MGLSPFYSVAGCVEDSYCGCDRDVPVDFVNMEEGLYSEGVVEMSLLDYCSVILVGSSSDRLGTSDCFN